MAENKKPLPQGITLRKDGRYQARYTFQGKRYTIYGRNLKEVQKKLRNAKYEMEHGIFARPEKIKVDDWHKTWEKEFRENKVKKSTYVTQQGLYKNHIHGPIGNLYLQAVRVEHIQNILNNMDKEGYSSSYIGRIREFMNVMFVQAFKSEIILRNPVEYTILPAKKERKERRVLTEYEQRLFLELISEDWLADIFYVGFGTGMRIGEILALEWKDIDFKKNEIYVSGNLLKLAGYEYEKTLPKTATSIRTIPMLPEISRQLRKHKLEQSKYKLTCRGIMEPVKGLEDLVFISRSGRPVSRNSLAYVIEKTIRRMNKYEADQAEKEKRLPIKFEHFSTHAMRHTFATRALENGIPPKVVQEILGHSSIQMTLDIYTHVLAETKEKEMQKLSRLFG